jgi:hypothetical protein
MFPQLTNSMVLLGKIEGHAPLSENAHLHQDISHLRENHLQATLLPQSLRTQAESTYIAHNMFGQIKMKIPWYNNRHTLNSMLQI